MNTKLYISYTNTVITTAYTKTSTVDEMGVYCSACSCATVKLRQSYH